MALNPPTQYASDDNLRARQRLWAQQQPAFDLVGWVLDLAGVETGQMVADVGCGNGAYLRALHARGIDAVGLDLSTGMLAAAGSDHRRVNAGAGALPLRSGSVDVGLAAHVLYHVDDRESAARELRRVVRPGGVAVAVTNGAGHLRSVRVLVEAAVQRATPGWEMPGMAYGAFSLENGAAQLAGAFAQVACVRASAPPAVVRDAGIVADYVGSLADLYEPSVGRPWVEVVAEVRREVQRVIDADGNFEVASDAGAFVCR